MCMPDIKLATTQNIYVYGNVEWVYLFIYSKLQATCNIGNKLYPQEFMQLEYIYIKTIIQYTVVLHSPAVDIRVRARGGNCVAHFPTLAPNIQPVLQTRS